MASFEKTGVVSIWAGVEKPDSEADVLKDLCGVEFYDLDCQEGAVADDWKPVDVGSLIRQLSYSESFAEEAISAAQSKGINKARWVVMQLDFAYKLNKVEKRMHRFCAGVTKSQDDSIMAGQNAICCRLLYTEKTPSAISSHRRSPRPTRSIITSTRSARPPR